MAGKRNLPSSDGPKKTPQEFLASIGPRPLTDEEARHLHILRIRAGQASSLGVIEKLAAEARLKAKKE